MTQPNTHSTAHLYARAFLNRYSTQLEGDVLGRFVQLKQYAESNPGIILSLGSAVHGSEKRAEALTLLCSRLGLQEPEKKLLTLLVQHRLFGLLSSVCSELIEQLHQLRGELVCSVYSSHELTGEQKEVLETFIAETTGMKIISRFVIDSQLIGGIRIQTPTFLWEDSVAGRLRELRKALNNRKTLS